MAQLVVSIRKMVKTRGAARRRTAEVDSWAGGEAAERLIAEAVQVCTRLDCGTAPSSCCSLGLCPNTH